MTARASNNQSPEGAHAGAMDRRRASEDRPGFLIPTANLHIVAIPLIILSTLAVGFLLVYLKEILVPFVVAMFFVYLLRPMVDVLTRPCADCCHESCIDSR